MRVILAKNWWSLVIRGAAAVLLGILTLFWPGITVAALVLLFGAYALVHGVMALAGALRASRAGERWGPLVVEGLIGIAAGVVAFAWPGITMVALVFVIAAWAIITGVLEIVTAVRLRKYIAREWLLGIMGVLSVVFGILLVMAPVAGALVLAIWVGAYALAFGVLEIALGFRLRKGPRTFDAGSPFPVPG